MSVSELVPGRRYGTTAAACPGPVVYVETVELTSNGGALVSVLWRGRRYIMGAEQLTEEAAS